jgi:hypothetical protein
MVFLARVHADCFFAGDGLVPAGVENARVITPRGLGIEAIEGKPSDKL